MKIHYGNLNREVTESYLYFKAHSGCYVEIAFRASGGEAEKQFRRLLQSKDDGNLYQSGSNGGGW